VPTVCRISACHDVGQVSSLWLLVRVWDLCTRHVGEFNEGQEKDYESSRRVTRCQYGVMSVVGGRDGSGTGAAERLNVPVGLVPGSALCPANTTSAISKMRLYNAT
jgi:hypothetical protein